MPEKLKFSRGLFYFAFSALTLQSLAKAETTAFQLLYQKNGDVADAFLSYSVAGAGDVNGDGKADFIIGAPFISPGGRTNAGSAYVYSGADGALLHQKDGISSGDQLGYSVAGAGDIDGDGKADFIIGAIYTLNGIPPDFFYGGSAYVYSGATGGVLYIKQGDDPGGQLGNSVAGAGDVNGDGKADFIVGAPFSSPGSSLAGSAYVYSGADGALLYQKDGENADDLLGFSVASAGDVDGDSRADFIIGAPFVDVGVEPGGLFFDAGEAYVYSGATGSLLYGPAGNKACEQLGYSVAGAGDVNGDTRADFIVGAIGAAPGGTDIVGSAYVYSGADGALLYQKDGSGLFDDFGFSVAGAGDADGDGKADFIIGARFADPGGVSDAGSAFLYSGLDGSLLFQKDGTGADDHMGYAVAGGGDVNEDGNADFIVGAEAADPGGNTDAGSAFVYGLIVTDVSEQESPRPAHFELAQNYPNPFNPTTTIQYYLPKREKVTLEIFNILGEQVRVLVDEEQAAGERTAVWDGKDGKGKILPSGIYFYRLKTKDYSEVKKMMFLK
ncbi:MAG: FG-GAP-like repeat-containing protein [candidate division Zixibacteria bacterium]|nr:FG-GAP-like repeat-containing protein [candidate division Zixibacteria bacterium]